ncbi:MAG TPA: DUF937 domain-containing protein [Longimicrobiales bacterium]|nr:DUF937 domain-containing protein [Longimicrobiales bacterium]
MSSILESVMSRIGDRDISQLSRTVGADENSTRTALSAALPMILAGLAKNSSRPEGAAALESALASDHDGGLLDNLSGFLDRGDAAPGDAILGHVFGERRGAVETGIGKSTGIDPAKAARLMAIAAPIVMAVLGKQRRQKQLDTGGLSDLLQRQNREVAQTAPQLGGLASLLDADGDGSVVDDIAGGLGKLFGR